jgi:phosphate uptake regulator
MSTIWISGRNYVTSLDKDFAEMIKREHNLRIDKVRIDDKTIITPPFDPYRKRKTEVLLTTNSWAELKTKVVNAYLNGYDIVDIQSTSPLSKELINLMQEAVPGVEILLTPNSLRHRVEFSGEYELPVKESFRFLTDLFKKFHETVARALGDFPDTTNLAQSYLEVCNYEKETDNVLYGFKRQLKKAMSHAGLYEKMGLQSDKDIIELHGILTYYERLGDLHREIIEREIKISEKNKSGLPSLKPFLTYYEHAYEVIQISEEAVTDPDKGLGIIEGKLSKPKWSSYKGGILLKSKEAMKRFIYSQNNPAFIRDLVILEGKLMAIPDICSNICELAHNMGTRFSVQPSTQSLF